MEYRQCIHYLKLSGSCSKDVLNIEPCKTSECSDIEGQSASSIMFEIMQLKRQIELLERKL